MKDQKSSDIKRGSWTKERVEIVGYAAWVIGIVCLLLIPAPCFDNQSRIYLSSAGLAIFGIGTGFIGLGVAHKSSKIMAAMANLEFYEKMAVIKAYIMPMCKEGTEEQDKAYADKIFYDVKGAKQLEGWVKDPKIAKMFNDEIQTLIDKALAGQKHEHLIKRLQEAKKDC